MSDQKGTPALTSTQSIQLNKLLGMPFTARLVLGGCTMEIADVLTLGQGSVLEMETSINDPLELWVNDRLVAKAETVVVNEKIGARIVQITPPEEWLKEMTTVE